MPIVSCRQRLHLVGVLLAVSSVTALNASPLSDTYQTTVASLLYDLKHPDAIRRQTAVKELGATRYRQAIPQLIPLTADPVSAVRRELELTLERMDDVAALPGFVALASDSETDIRARAAASIVNTYVPHAIGVTLANLREIAFGSPGDLDVFVEPDVVIDATALETLRARIDDSDRGIRRTAIRGMGILRARAAIPDLLRVVREDRDDALRLDGVRSLRKIDDPSVGADLVPLLNINSNDVRYELIATLGSLRYQPAVPELTRLLVESKETDVVAILALAALADLADPTSMATFDGLKNHKDERLRLFANEGIARLADQSRKTEISAARLVEKSPRVKTAQAFALFRLGQPEYLDELVRALERPATRDLAKEYLLETQPAAREALFVPRTTNASARAELAEVFGLMGDPRALPRLQELRHDSDKDVVQAAERATRRIAVSTSQ
jgi:HEAT repeat protein